LHLQKGIPLEHSPPIELPVRIETRADFEVIFKTHYSSLCSYANGFLKDVDASEEVVQEVMVKMWTNREFMVIDTSLNSYLFRAVRNGSLNVLKHMKIRDEYRMLRENEPAEGRVEGLFAVAGGVFWGGVEVNG
jgi:RNA polymerase sigma-70 factor (ECF subfamily)